jgi:transcription initiation factor TFIIB
MNKKTTQQLEELTVCPECKSHRLSRDTLRAEIVCKDCGLVIDEDLLDYGPDWRAFDAEQKNKRAHTGTPTTPLLSDKGLTTTIGWKDRDSFGHRIPAKNRAQIYRLRKWQKRIRAGKNTQRNLSQALITLNQISSTMMLPRDIRETAAMIYRKVQEKDLIRGRSIQAVAAAAIYAACRQLRIPRSLDEIAEASAITRKEIGRNYLCISRGLKLRVQPASPNDYISRFSSQLKLTTKVQRKALDIVQLAEEEKILNGRAPIGVAAAAIYISSVLCAEPRSQKQVANVSCVTEVTIRNRYKELVKKLNLDLAL